MSGMLSIPYFTRGYASAYAAYPVAPPMSPGNAFVSAVSLMNAIILISLMPDRFIVQLINYDEL